MGFCPEFQPGDPARVGIVGLNLLKWGIMFKILPVPVTQPVDSEWLCVYVGEGWGLVGSA